MRIASRLLACLAAAAVLTGRAAAVPAAVAPAPDVQVDDAWIRWLPADVPSAGYMTLINNGSKPRVLVDVSSTAYAEVSIHQTLEDHGVSSMRPVDSITLAPKAVVRFAESGYHLMLMHPRHPVHPGDKLVMTLRFAQAPPIDVVFSVRAGG